MFPQAFIERQRPRRTAAGRHPLHRASQKGLSLSGDGADPDGVQATAIFTWDGPLGCKSPGLGLVRLSIRWGYVLGVRLGVRCFKVGVVDRRSEEQGVEAGSSATQLAVRQSTCLLCDGRTHPSLGWRSELLQLG